MRLHYLAEATLKDIEKRIPIFIKKHYKNTSPDKATKIIEQLAALDPTRGKYAEWIIRQYNDEEIRIPEDNVKITSLLKRFHQYKQLLSDKDINNYMSPDVLAGMLDEIGISAISKRQAKKAGRAGQMTLPPGAELVYDRLHRVLGGHIQVVKITDPKASTILCSGTDWCTANLESATDYLKNGSLYIIYKDNKRYVIANAEYEQVTDADNNDLEQSEELTQILKLLYRIDTDFALFYASESGIRIPAIESQIIDKPSTAYRYARDVIKGRWPEAEPAILKDPDMTRRYAKDVIKGRWPEAEELFGLAFFESPKRRRAAAH